MKFTRRSTEESFEVDIVQTSPEKFTAILHGPSTAEHMPAEMFLRLMSEGEIRGTKNKKRAREYAKSMSAAEDVFGFWKKLFNKTDASKLTAERVKLVNQRLKDGYSAQDLKDNFVSAATNPFYLERDITKFESLLKSSTGIETRLNELRERGNHDEAAEETNSTYRTLGI